MQPEADLEDTVSSLTHGKLLLHMMNDDSPLPEIFSFFCHERHAAENFLVWKAIQEWKKDPNPPAGKEILDTYLKEDAPHQINIDFATSSILEELFDNPQVIDGSKPLTGKEFTNVETDLIQLLLVSLIPPFQLQFSSIYSRFQNQGKVPVPHTRSPPFGIPLDAEDRSIDMSLYQDEKEKPASAPSWICVLLHRIFFFWRSE